MAIKLTFLGTAGAVPSAKRNHTGILLSYGSENILIDCGEGIQRQFRKARLNLCKVTRILITHWHGDHVLGLPGLMQTLAFSDYKKTLHIYGPKGTEKYMKKMLETFVFVNKISLKIHEVDKEGIFLDEEDFYLESKKMTHGIYCNAYCFVKKGKLRINKQKLTKSGLPSGPILSKLKQGEDIVYQGKKYKAKDLTYMADSVKICFVMDTSLNKKIVPFVDDSDLLVAEATLGSELESIAEERKHLTSKQAAEIAKKAKVKKLAITHVSQRYDKDFSQILKQAKEIFKKSYLVEDLEIIEV